MPAKFAPNTAPELDRPFHQYPGQRVSTALARFAGPALAETADQRPGLPPAMTTDIWTLQFFYRGRLDIDPTIIDRFRLTVAPGATGSIG